MARSTPSTRLRDKTLVLVRALPRNVTLYEVAIACKLPYGWLTAFSRGEIEHPSVNRIECLWEYLTQRRLGVD